jgi:hypothetical protein
MKVENVRLSPDSLPLYSFTIAHDRNQSTTEWQTGYVHINCRASGLFGQLRIKELAKGDASRKRRFLAAVNRGAELLFSVANAAELTGFQDGSSREVRAFLEEIGPHWFPVELDPKGVRFAMPHKIHSKSLLPLFVRALTGFRVVALRLSPAFR